LAYWQDLPGIGFIRFKPVKVLKGSISANEEPGKIPWLRHGLVITQFTLSVLLIHKRHYCF
jgi:putative ABC transport system permease protein